MPLEDDPQLRSLLDQLADIQSSGRPLDHQAIDEARRAAGLGGSGSSGGGGSSGSGLSLSTDVTVTNGSHGAGEAW